MIKNAFLWKQTKWYSNKIFKYYTTAEAKNYCKGKNRRTKDGGKGTNIEQEQLNNIKNNKKEIVRNVFQIEEVKNEKELKTLYHFYDETKEDHLFRDYQNLINNNYIKNKCGKKEVEECTKIVKYVTNVTLLTHFLKKKERDIKENKGEYKSMTNNIYYIHNIEKAKINKEEFITKHKDTNLCLKYFLENNIYKFIYKLKKCDLWNYREKISSKCYVNYFLLFPLAYGHVEKQNANFDSSFEYTIFFNGIHRYNKNAFINIIKNVNYKILNSAEINNLLIALTVLHHNNKSFCYEKTEVNKYGKKKEALKGQKDQAGEGNEDRNGDGNGDENGYENGDENGDIGKEERQQPKMGLKLQWRMESEPESPSISKYKSRSKWKSKLEQENEKGGVNKNGHDCQLNVTNCHPEYTKKKIFVDIFNNIYKCIDTKVNYISFLYLYDFILLMSINEIKNREAYVNVVNILSNYMNVINKLSNQINNKNEEFDKIDGVQYYEDDIYENMESEKWEKKTERNGARNVEKNENRNQEINNHTKNKSKSESESENENESENEFAQERNEENGFIIKNCKIAEEDMVMLNSSGKNDVDIIYENENFQMKRSIYKHIKQNLFQIKNIVLSKVLLIYIMKYVYSHIDNNVLYAHSDIICENLELLHQHLITNFIFTIGTCKHIDEFCMFMLAKFVQNNVQGYTPNDITIIVNTYADASLEDVSFYETICDYIKNNFYKFLATDIIKIVYAFSKVRIRDEVLLKMAYQRINEYLEEREKKYFYLKRDDTTYTTNYQVPKEKEESTLLLNKEKHKGRYIINKYLCAYAIIAAGKLDFFEGLNKLFFYLRKSILTDGIDIRGMLWMPITLTNFLSSECIFQFLPVYVDLIYKAFKKTESSKLMTLLIRRHNILLHTIETNIIPKKYIDESTLNKLYFICKSKKDTSKEKVFVPDSSTFHIEVSNALLSLDIPHKKEVNIYPFTIDIFIKTTENAEMTASKKRCSNSPTYRADQEMGQDILANNNQELAKEDVLTEDTYFQETFETKHVKNKVKNKNEVYTDIPFA